MKIIAIIPARMASTRFPGKPLALIREIPMIGHVYFRSKMCNLLNDVYVATCDTEIEEYIKSINGNVIMTSAFHERASDRVAEAVAKIEKNKGVNADIIVMVQGDEPMLCPTMIEAAVEPMLTDRSIQVVNLMSALIDEEEGFNPNIVKVVTDINNYALYFSREPIPSHNKYDKKIVLHKQIAIIPFRREFLVKYNNLEQTPLEIIESVDMLRILEHGYKVYMVQTDKNIYSVDTEDDLRKVEAKMNDDQIINSYLAI